MKNDPVRSNNLRSKEANFSCRAGEESVFCADEHRQYSIWFEIRLLQCSKSMKRIRQSMAGFALYTIRHSLGGVTHDAEFNDGPSDFLSFFCGVGIICPRFLLLVTSVGDSY